MKDKTMMMYEYIRSSVDVDPWAIIELKNVVDAYLSYGCGGCAFETYDEWQMPCEKCRRNVRDYWRKAEVSNEN